MAEQADVEPEIHELLAQNTYNDNCQGQVICVVTFLPNIYDSNAADRNKQLQLLMQAAKSNRKQPFVWFWL